VKINAVFGSALTAIRRTLHGTGAFPWIGLAFVVGAAAFLASILLTPGGWGRWQDATAVHGTERNGIVYYTYRGVNYTVDDVGTTRNGTHTVYVVASQAWNGQLDDEAILDWTVTIGPCVVGAAFVSYGIIRRNRRRRGGGKYKAGVHGGGLDPDTVQRLLAQQRADGQHRAPN
jgi:hypothetical protein